MILEITLLLIAISGASQCDYSQRPSPYPFLFGGIFADTRVYFAGAIGEHILYGGASESSDFVFLSGAKTEMAYCGLLD